VTPRRPLSDALTVPRRPFPLVSGRRPTRFFPPGTRFEACLSFARTVARTGSLLPPAQPFLPFLKEPAPVVVCIWEALAGGARFFFCPPFWGQCLWFDKTDHPKRTTPPLGQAFVPPKLDPPLVYTRDTDRVRDLSPPTRDTSFILVFPRSRFYPERIPRMSVQCK